MRWQLHVKSGSVRPNQPLIAWALAASSCGSSFQATYECDVHFEHCYALDQTGASTDTKRQCWRDWLRGYTYAQSRDRIAYATTRVNQLAADPPPSGEAAVTLSVIAAPTAAAPLPTNAFAPPPNVSESHSSALAEGAVDAGPSRDAALRAPGAECAETCKDRWSECRRSCSEAKCGACDRMYKSCMAACFRDEPAGSRLPGRGH